MSDSVEREEGGVACKTSLSEQHQGDHQKKDLNDQPHQEHQNDLAHIEELEDEPAKPDEGKTANTNQEPNKPSLSLIFTVLAVSLLAIILAREMEKKLIDAEQYAVDVTLDPDTEHLIQNILSEDGKQGSLEEEKKLHMDLERVNRKLEEDLKRSQESIMDLEKDKQQSDQKIKEQQGSLEEEKKLHMDLERVNRKLQEDLKRSQESIMDLEKDKQQSDQKIKEQQGSLEEEKKLHMDLERVNRKLEEDLKRSQESIMDLEKDKQQSDQKIKEQQGSLEEEKKLHMDLERVNRELEEDLKRSQESIMDLEKDKQQSDQKIKEQQARIEELEEESAKPDEEKTANTNEEPDKPSRNLILIFTALAVALLAIILTHSQEMEKLKKTHSQTIKELQDRIKELEDAELKRIQRHAVDVTLDADTAHPHLILSEDRKQVSCGDMRKNLPDNKERFSKCASVLGKQSFSSRRLYYEVQVKGKTKWDLGVARESINRKGSITVTPNNGYWAIRLRNRNEYKACADPHVLLPVREEVQKVGVFVDYEEGLVSFYDVEARVHLYSFTGWIFTEKLYPYFSPCVNDGGTNSAPLIISPVSVA